MLGLWITIDTRNVWARFSDLGAGAARLAQAQAGSRRAPGGRLREYDHGYAKGETARPNDVLARRKRRPPGGGTRPGGRRRARTHKAGGKTKRGSVASATQETPPTPKRNKRAPRCGPAVGHGTRLELRGAGARAAGRAGRARQHPGTRAAPPGDTKGERECTARFTRTGYPAYAARHGTTLHARAPPTQPGTALRFTRAPRLR
ncbi:hypothetical protein LCGC14_1225220, partial [marine sediment metagenome]